MRQTLAHVALLVRDYDEAIAYFTRTLRFTLVQDSPLGPGKRWVVVGEKGTILSSEDGVAWNPAVGGTEDYFMDVLWDGSRFVTVGVIWLWFRFHPGDKIASEA